MQKTVETNQDVVDLVEKNKWKRLGITLAKDWRLYVLLIPMLLFLIFFKYIPVYGILTGSSGVPITLILIIYGMVYIGLIEYSLVQMLQFSGEHSEIHL